MKKLFFLFLTLTLVSFFPIFSQVTKHKRTLKEKFINYLPYFLQQAFNEKTPTETFINKFRPEIKKRFPKALQDTTTQECIRRERLYQKTHAVLYHAQARSVWEIVRWNKAIYLACAHYMLNKEIKPNDLEFEFLRSLDSIFPEETQENYLAQQIKPFDSSFDTREEVRNRLISVNPSLFNNFSNSGECTYALFCQNYSMELTNNYTILKKLFSAFNFDQSYMQQAKNNKKEQDQEKGILHQIFIPLEKDLNEIVYCSGSFGVPCDLSTPTSITLKKYNENPLGAIEPEKPEQISFQARILMTPKMCTPGNIKIFSYGDDNPNVTKELYQRAREMVGNALAKGNYTDRLVELCDGILKNRQVLGVAESQPPSIDSDKKYAAYKQQCSHKIQLRKRKLLALGRYRPSHNWPTQAATEKINAALKI